MLYKYYNCISVGTICSILVSAGDKTLNPSLTLCSSSPFNYQFIDFLDGSELLFIDLNKDGMYVDPHEDAVEIAHKSIKNLHEFHKNFVPMNDTFNFMIDGNYFKIDKFDLRNKKNILFN